MNGIIIYSVKPVFWSVKELHPWDRFFVCKNLSVNRNRFGKENQKKYQEVMNIYGKQKEQEADG